MGEFNVIVDHEQQDQGDELEELVHIRVLRLANKPLWVIRLSVELFASDLSRRELMSKVLR